jgi:ABC-type multidrug transport system permease subunit
MKHYHLITKKPSVAVNIPLTINLKKLIISSGFLVSSICDEETSAIHFALGSFYLNLLLSGVLWPMEGMPVYLRYISYFLPQTYAIESLRNIFSRAWGMDRPEVYLGVATTFGWIIALLALSIIVIRVRKYTG